MLAKVTLPTGGGSVDGVTRVEIRTQEYLHDTAVFAVVGTDRRRFRTDAPVKITYAGGVFTGYILSVRVNNFPAARRGFFLEARCIGATSPCRTGRQRSWAGSTDAQIVQSIAKLHKLTAAVEPLKTRHKMMNQAGKSDWSFMVERAKVNGFVVYPRGTQIRFHSRAFELNRYGNAAPRIGRSELISFVPDVSEVVSGGGPKAVVAVAGVDSNGAAYAGSEQPAGISTRVSFDTTVVTSSAADAQERTAALAQLNSWTYRARAEIRGNPRVRVGSPVFFADVEGEYEGFWVAQRVDHLITPQSYTTHVIVGVDVLGRGYVAAPPDGKNALVTPDGLGLTANALADEPPQLMDPSFFDPESALPAPEDLSYMMIDFGEERSTAPVGELQWAVPPIQPDLGYDEVALPSNVLGLTEQEALNDGYVVKQLVEDPPLWLLERAYP